MKRNSTTYRIIACCIVLFVLACSKTNLIESETLPERIDIDSVVRSGFFQSVPLGSLVQCNNGPKYIDSMFYNQANNGSDYVVKPINTPGEGKYYSWPVGLVIDSLSGSINVTRSESGLQYLVGFVRSGTHDTCVQSIIISGVSYIDSIYVLSNSQALAAPYFNASLQTPSICVPGPGDDDHHDVDGNDRCEFRASNGKVKVRAISGTLDLKETVENGAFGPNPSNGTAIKVKLIYKLNDNSNKAAQQMEVQMVYYETRAQVPQSVVNYVTQRRNDIITQGFIIRGNPRPPLIVITRS